MKRTPPEPPTPAQSFAVAPKWVDAAGRARTWNLCDPTGAPVAEITTRRAAQELAILLNRLRPERFRDAA